MSTKLYIVGMPAAGKTSFGKRLAKYLQYDFLDLDAYIEQQEQDKISHIFEEKGEDYFRLLERKYLRATQKHENVIIATGGGAPCFYDNMEWMNKHGQTLFIDHKVATLVERLLLAKNRPLIEQNKQSLQKYVETLYHKRIPFYNQAQLKLEGPKVDVDALMKQYPFLKK